MTGKSLTAAAGNTWEAYSFFILFLLPFTKKWCIETHKNNERKEIGYLCSTGDLEALYHWDTFPIFFIWRQGLVKLPGNNASSLYHWESLARAHELHGAQNTLAGIISLNPWKRFLRGQDPAWVQIPELNLDMTRNENQLLHLIQLHGVC